MNGANIGGYSKSSTTYVIQIAKLLGNVRRKAKIYQYKLEVL